MANLGYNLTSPCEPAPIGRDNISNVDMKYLQAYKVLRDNRQPPQPSPVNLCTKDGNRDSADTTTEDECTICYDRFNPEDKPYGLLENCSHSFCATCIIAWLQASEGEGRTCPMCRILSRRMVIWPKLIKSKEEKKKIFEYQSKAVSLYYRQSGHRHRAHTPHRHLPSFRSVPPMLPVYLNNHVPMGMYPPNYAYAPTAWIAHTTTTHSAGGPSPQAGGHIHVFDSSQHSQQPRNTMPFANINAPSATGAGGPLGHSEIPSILFHPHPVQLQHSANGPQYRNHGATAYIGTAMYARPVVTRMSTTSGISQQQQPTGTATQAQ